MTEEFRDYPLTFPSHSKPAARRYRMRRDCFACPDVETGIAGLPVLASLPAEGLEIIAAAPDELGAELSASCRPVYAFSESELPAVPTGRLFVRGAPDVDLAATLRPLGYEIESVPAYAAEAAWIVAADGSVASALSGIDKLIAADGIESVEPQMLRPAGRRGDDAREARRG